MEVVTYDPEQLENYLPNQEQDGLETPCYTLPDGSCVSRYCTLHHPQEVSDVQE